MVTFPTVDPFGRKFYPARIFDMWYSKAIHEWLLWVIGAGQIHNLDLMEETDKWYWGYYGSNPTIFFVDEKDQQKFLQNRASVTRV